MLMKSLNQYDRLLELDGENKEILIGMENCMEQYINSLLQEEKYDVIKELAQNYQDHEQIMEVLTSCLQKYIDALMEEGKYDEIRELAGLYEEVLPGIDFQEILREIEAKEAEPAASASSQKYSDSEIPAWIKQAEIRTVMFTSQTWTDEQRRINREMWKQYWGDQMSWPFG